MKNIKKLKIHSNNWTKSWKKKIKRLESEASSTGKGQINKKKSIKLMKVNQLKKKPSFLTTKIKKDSWKVIERKQENKKKKKGLSEFLVKRTD